MPRPTRRERRRWRMDYKRDVPKAVRRRAARRLNRERRAKRRQAVPISNYDRERNGTTEHVRDYEQERSVNAPSPPSFRSLGRERGVEPTMFWAGKTHEWHLRRYPTPGKFEGEPWIASYIWDLSMVGGGGVGNEQDMGWYADQVDLGPDAVDDMEQAAKDAGDPPLTEDEKDFIRHMAGAIAEENDVGFVSVEFFETKDELEKKWKEYEDAEAEFYEAQEEAEGEE